MNDHKLDDFERQLRRVRPAKLPEDFNARLLAVGPKAKIIKAIVKPAPQPPATADFFGGLRLWLRWLIPAAAVAVAAMVAWHDGEPFSKHMPGLRAGSRADGGARLKVDDVKIDQRLVSSFDTVARLSTGEPMRFHCENWVDQVVVSDKSHGLLVENSKPRFEVVPVGFETY